MILVLGFKDRIYYLKKCNFSRKSAFFLLTKQNFQNMMSLLIWDLIAKKVLTQIKNDSHFPHFCILCDTRKKKTGYAIDFWYECLTNLDSAFACFMFHIMIVDFTLSKTKRFTLLILIGDLGMTKMHENKKGLTCRPTVSKFMRFRGLSNMFFFSCSLADLFTIFTSLGENSNYLLHNVLSSLRRSGFFYGLFLFLGLLGRSIPVGTDCFGIYQHICLF